MFSAELTIAGFDPQLAKAIAAERGRQEHHIELIASENYASPRVLEAQGSVLTNKHADGYRGKRYYRGRLYLGHPLALAVGLGQERVGGPYADGRPRSRLVAN